MSQISFSDGVHRIHHVFMGICEALGTLASKRDYTDTIIFYLLYNMMALLSTAVGKSCRSGGQMGIL